MTKKPKTPIQPEASDTAGVDAYMKKLKHPLKAEIEVVRSIIKGADKRIAERVKWNAPSFFFVEDMVTFNHRNEQLVQLVFHHPSIVRIPSDRLLGKYKDRRLMHFSDMKEIRKYKKELQTIMRSLIKLIDQQ
jgi:hypothetical protein